MCFTSSSSPSSCATPPLSYSFLSPTLCFLFHLRYYRFCLPAFVRSGCCLPSAWITAGYPHTLTHTRAHIHLHTCANKRNLHKNKMKYEQGKGKNRANEPERESSRKGHKYAIIIWTRECGCAYACHFYHTHKHTHRHTHSRGHTMQRCGCIINAKLLHLLAVHGTVIDMQLSSIVRCMYVCACPRKYATAFSRWLHAQQKLYTQNTNYRIMSKKNRKNTFKEQNFVRMYVCIKTSPTQ